MKNIDHKIEEEIHYMVSQFGPSPIEGLMNWMETAPELLISLTKAYNTYCKNKQDLFNIVGKFREQQKAKEQEDPDSIGM